MKKWLKVIGIIILALLITTISIALYFNQYYKKEQAKYQQEQATLKDSKTVFYQFELKSPPSHIPPILPVPQSFSWNQGLFKWPTSWNIHCDIEDENDVNSWFEIIFDAPATLNTSQSNIDFARIDGLKKDGYQIETHYNKIKVKYTSLSGIFYALTTLHHLQELYPEEVKNFSIVDEPDLEIRGVMLDISRDKVPKLSTLYQIVDQLSMLKYNHLQLYVEGFSFAYPSFSRLWEEEYTPITPDEIKQLDLYCKMRCIDLAANQNSLGHMQPWLETEEYGDLAECPDGFALVPMMKMKATLDPLDPGSIKLVKEMMDDIIPHFTSSIFNANLDEPFELGHCKNKHLAEELGVGRLYLDFVKKVHEHTLHHQKTMWMWGDIVNKHPEILDELADDIVLLEWGYEHDHPFEKNTSTIKDKGLDFLVCPGSSSWMSLTGRTENMLGNISNAVLAGVKNNAIGMLLTDWGDMGHWQYLPVSYTAFAYGGGVSWNSKTIHNLPLEEYLNIFTFKDDQKQLAALAMEIGRYNQFEEIEMPNSSLAFLSYQFGLVDPLMQNSIIKMMREVIGTMIGEESSEMLDRRFNNKKEFQYQEMVQHLESAKAVLYEPEMNLDQVNIVKDEFRNGLLMVELAGKIRNYGANHTLWSQQEKVEELKSMRMMIAEIKEEHQRLWLLRNKSGGLEHSMKAMVKIESQINKKLEVNSKAGIPLALDNLKSRVITGGVAWYLQK